MLVGYTYDEQLFLSEAFRMFQDIFLNKNSGVLKGCELNKTNNTVTIGDGWFCIRGGFLRELGGTTLNVTDNGYYSLVCEIDLTKQNTETIFLQGEYKLLKGVSTYPTLTQEDITMGDGTKYQFEFARFQFNGNIMNFTDRRMFLNFEGIYKEIRQALQELISGGKVDGDFQISGAVTSDGVNNICDINRK